MIPKVIHQIWIGNENPKPQRLMNTWKNMHPEWQYIEWNEKQIEELPLINHKQYEAMTHLRYKCNIARMEILFRLGGIYIDADSECLCELPLSLLDNNAFAFKYRFGGFVLNAFVGCVPNCSVILRMIEAISKFSPSYILEVGDKITTDGYEDVRCGTDLFTKIAKYDPAIQIYKNKYLITLIKHYLAASRNPYRDLQ